MAGMPAHRKPALKMPDRRKKHASLNDRDGISSVYEEYSGALRGFISSRIGSEEDTEDILHNVFYNLSRIDLMENPIEHISGWLYSVARNQIADRRKKKKEQRYPEIKPGGEDDLSLDLSMMLAATDGDPERDYLVSLVWEEFCAALEELPQEQRVVFELNELEGIPFREISDTTGIPVNTLLSRKRYAVLTLRERLKSLYDELIL